MVFLTLFLTACVPTAQTRLDEAGAAKAGGELVGQVIEIAERVEQPTPDSPGNCGASYFAHASIDDSDDVKIKKFDNALTLANRNSVDCEAWWQETYRQIVGAE